jgi:hypothetical protein
MNLDALREINNNCSEVLEQSARNNSVDEEIIKGIASYVVINGYEALSDKQKYHFDNSIRHLIENVRCPGYTHEFEEIKKKCENILDDEVLVDFYKNDGVFCESCQGQSDADAHSKASFFKD